MSDKSGTAARSAGSGKIKGSERKTRTEILHIGGMTCANCERTIERGLRKLGGVAEASVSYGRGTARVVFDDSIELADIKKTIQDMDYSVLSSEALPGAEERFDMRQLLGVICLVFAAYIFAQRPGAGIFNLFPQAEKGMGYGALFVVGLLTSVHCIAMCGGINISQCLDSHSSGDCGKKTCGAAYSSLRPSLLYNAGRVVSYTVAGGLVGALGAVVSFSGAARGLVQLAAGVFMVIIGVNMLGILSPLRRLTPRLPKFVTDRVERGKGGRGPLYVGLLNGLMPCGPLQAMQLYALYTGSVLQGALSMFVFSLGTVPLMFGLGAFSALLSKKFTARVMKIGASVVIIMGVVMFSNGMALSGLSGFAGLDGFDSPGVQPVAVSQGAAAEAFSSGAPGDVQLVNTPLGSRGYPSITVRAGTPVRWTISAAKGTINGCNNTIIIPAFNLEKRLSVGDNVIEFTPAKSGVYRYSCWMGMIRGKITVVDGDLPAGTGESPTSLAPSGLLGVVSAAEANEPGIGGDFDDDEPQDSGGCLCCF
ncbi:MAG: sulfite exporter TauE/SafE family protein [Synergistaceae bacterium]|jgi:sulfite exporter TauE/SafE/copper chaperone CopZ|nr:sulfite exporter TauE/SafE family protein [Synergistaceae bacterium]